MASTVQQKNKYFDAWCAYVQPLGVDPWLPQQDCLYLQQIRAISGFGARVKTGFYGFGREISASSVSTALTAIGQTISMDRNYNPLKMNGSDKLLQPLQLMMSGFKKWDKPVEKKLPVEADVVELLCMLGQLELASTKEAVLGDWALIAFYYLLRVGEYTEKSERGDSKQTVSFRMKDVTFFEFDSKKRLTQMPRNASDERIMNAAGCTLRLSNQKNGWKNVCIFHFANGEDIACPIRALGRRYCHIRDNSTNPEEKLSAYFVNGVRYHLKDREVGASLKAAAEKLDYPERGIPIESIDTHSLRSGGANALHLAGYSDREIQKMGRWRSDTFKEYIRENLSVFSQGMSTAMKKTFRFVNIQGGMDHDLQEAEAMTAAIIASPYEVCASAA